MLRLSPSPLGGTRGRGSGHARAALDLLPLELSQYLYSHWLVYVIIITNITFT